MNIRFGLVAGAAVACAVMSGCKAPKAQSTVRPIASTQRVEKSVDVQPSKSAPVSSVKNVETVSTPVVEPLRCKCVPGSVHTKPCACGASNCKCKVKPVEPEYTLYRIKGGDILSAICATYGLKQSKVLDLNPGLDPNKLFVGKKIKLPGKIALKDSDVKSLAKKPVVKKSIKSAKAVSSKATSYNGPTKEYVVKSGDSLGKIAYSNGITIKCLKDMNGLKKNMIRIGQKLKVPAEKPVVSVKKDKVAPSSTKAASDPVKKATPPAEVVPVAPVVEPKASEVPATPTEPVATTPAEVTTPAVEPTTATSESTTVVEPVKEETPTTEAPPVSALTHTVAEGEDTVSIAIKYSVSPSALMDLNDLKNTDSLKVGQVLKLPANAKAQ